MLNNTLREAVEASAKKLDLLDEKGALVRLDSLAVIDLAMEIEDSLKIRIPTASLTLETFASLDTLTEFLQEVSSTDRS